MIYKFWLYFDLSIFCVWNAEYKAYSYTVLKIKLLGYVCSVEMKQK